MTNDENRSPLEIANTWAEKQNSIYVSAEDKRIADAGAAKEIADQLNLHKGTDLEDIGEKAASEIENRRESEARKLTGEQEDRKKWIEEVLMVKYPGAISEHFDGGQQFWVIKTADKDLTFFSVDGLFTASLDRDIKADDVSLEKITTTWKQMLVDKQRWPNTMGYTGIFARNLTKEPLSDNGKIISVREIYPDNLPEHAQELSRILTNAKTLSESEESASKAKKDTSARSFV